MRQGPVFEKSGTKEGRYCTPNVVGLPRIKVPPFTAGVHHDEGMAKGSYEDAHSSDDPIQVRVISLSASCIHTRFSCFVLRAVRSRTASSDSVMWTFRGDQKEGSVMGSKSRS